MVYTRADAMERIFGSVRTTYTTQFIDQVRAGWRASCGIANALPKRVSRELLCAIGFLSYDRRRLSHSLGPKQTVGRDGTGDKGPLPSTRSNSSARRSAD